MSPRALVYSVIAAVALALPAAAEAATVVASINGGAAVSSGTAVQGSCAATLVSSSMYGTETFVSATAALANGTFAGGATTLTLAAADVSPATPKMLDITPGAAGATLQLTCSVTTNLTYRGLKTDVGTASVVIGPAQTVPVIDAVSMPPADVIVGMTYPVSVTAHDSGGSALTYAWSATCGSFDKPATASPSWTAPGAPGACTLTVTVTNASSLSAPPRSQPVNVALSIYQASMMKAAMRFPERVAATASGDLLVVDTTGRLFLATKRGELRGSIGDLGAKAVAFGGGVAYVATHARGILKIDPDTGRQVGMIPWSSGLDFTGLAWDATRSLLWGSIGNVVVALRADGSIATQLSSLGPTGRALNTMGDVALDARDPANPILWVGEKNPNLDYRVHAFNPADGSYLRSMVATGSGLGQVVTLSGLAVDGSGRVYFSDANNVVQSVSPAGVALGSIGQRGNVDGYLLNPQGLAFMANGDLAVANANLDRVDRYGTGAALPTCQVNGQPDSDCDGLPDWWELKYGLNPNDPSDALIDPDGDGLNNLEEYRHGTNPKNRDTDGDGFSDGAEVLAGFNPLDPNDHNPTMVASNLGPLPPGLVKLGSSAGNAATCSASWKQTSGAKVTLRDADTFTPSFIARTAGTYKFDAAAICGTATSAVAGSQVVIANVPPLADAGRLLVTSPGKTVQLNAGFSSDANGGPLGFAWEQVAGPPTTVASRGAVLSVRPMQEGYYAYLLTATDDGGAKGATLVGVVVAGSTLPTAAVASPVVTAVAGATVTLDASASVPADAAFAWGQVDEATGNVTPIGTTAVTTVTVPAAGRYLFQVTASKGGVTSPPATVVVLAGTAGLPTATVTAPAAGAVNTALVLDGGASTATSGALNYAWRQIAGPAAGLTGADAAVATAVPFGPGVYEFQLTVTDGSGAVSAPATTGKIAVTVPAGKALPVASAVAPATATVSQLILLDGRGSTGAARYRWTQVAGPWTAIDATSAAPVFIPGQAGTYRFELIVDDGQVRSAPATVTVTVQ